PLNTEAFPLLLSAKSEPALQEAAARLGAYLRANPDQNPTDVAFSLATARGSMEHRAALLGSEREELLNSLAQGEPAGGLLKASAQATGPLVFMFPGQGSQWEGMALELLEGSPLFAQKMAECEEAIKAFIPFSMREALAGEEESQKRLDVV